MPLRLRQPKVSPAKGIRPIDCVEGRRRPPHAQRGVDVGAKTILLVEDNYDNREIYRTIMDASGYQLLEAHNSAEGVRLAQEHRPDLILMDLSMPVLDGWKAMALLRADDRTKHIPVLALSAHVVLDGDFQPSQEAGFAAYLTKPIEPKRVLQEVQSRIGAAEPVSGSVPGAAQ